MALSQGFLQNSWRCRTVTSRTAALVWGALTLPLLQTIVCRHLVSAEATTVADCLQPCLSTAHSQAVISVGPEVDSCILQCNVSSGSEPLVRFSIPDHSVYNISEATTYGNAAVLNLSTLITITNTTIAGVLISVRYAAVDSSYKITVGQDSGDVVLLSAFDYELQRQHTVLVYAWVYSVDGVVLFNQSAVLPLLSASRLCLANTSVVLNITNVNDNSPVFARQSYSLVVTSGFAALFETLAKIPASDADGDAVGYQLVGISSPAPESQPLPFGMDNATGSVSVTGNVLDGLYNMTLIATDGRHFTGVSLLITVINSSRLCSDDSGGGSLCRNGGTCVRDSAESQTGGFTCYCVPGFKGSMCEVNDTCVLDVNSACSHLPQATCSQGQQITTCLHPASTVIVREYKPLTVYSSISYPALDVYSSQAPRLCYATSQFQPQLAASSAVKVQVNASVSRNVFSLSLLEEDAKALSVFLQVCCPDQGCFDIGSLHSPPDPNVQFMPMDFKLSAQLVLNTEVLPCPVLPRPTGGVLSCETSADGSYFVSCQYSCNELYFLRGAQELVCLSNGTWNHERAVCWIPDCGELPLIVSSNNFTAGQPVCTGLTYTQTCVITCPRGSRLHVAGRRQCLVSGNWSSSSVECRVFDPCLAGTHNCHATLGVCQLFASATFGCSCTPGYAGNGFYCSADRDDDGIPDEHMPECNTTSRFCRADNCLSLPNSDQDDSDGDGLGDLCDSDSDGDGVLNDNDNCQRVANVDQVDSDGDALGNACDNCVDTPNFYQTNSDADALGDACDEDADNDSVMNVTDNCIIVPNLDQVDTDADGVGDACDNCPHLINPDQVDTNQNGLGDACTTGTKDTDGDGRPDPFDNCIYAINIDQLDTDNDGLGDACDLDVDNDTILNDVDNCPLVANADQVDGDGNRVGDQCEQDSDGDGVPDTQDACPFNRDVQATDFRRFLRIALDPIGQTQADPVWVILDQGAQILQLSNSDPGIAVGETSLDYMSFSGTFYIGQAANVDDDYAGFVFGYQSNTQFYVCIWKRQRQYSFVDTPHPRPVARVGIQLRALNSSTGPSTDLAQSLWYSGSMANQSHLIYHENSVSWQFETPYRWTLIHNPQNGYIRMQWYQGSTKIADSLGIHDTTMRGGRLGVAVYSQANITYSKLRYTCLRNTDYALSFSGNTAGIALTGSKQLSILDSSFTVNFWAYMRGCSNPQCNFNRQLDFGVSGDASVDFGIFHQVSSALDDYDLLVHSGTTPTSSTGPSDDHTPGDVNGNYLYLEASTALAVNRYGARAILESDCFLTATLCSLSFYYHMYALSATYQGQPLDGMGWLEVEVLDLENQDTAGWQLVWSMWGDQGNSWHKATVDLSSYKGAIQLRLVVWRGALIRSDIALDDIEFSAACGITDHCTAHTSKPIIGSSNTTGLSIQLNNAQVVASFQDASISSMGRIEFNRWTHIAYQYDMATRTQSLWVNGVVNGSAAGSGPYTHDFPFILGGSDLNNQTLSNCILDEIRLGVHLTAVCGCN
ncbi:uncharacterized protein LOC135804439 isoform X2 [Sycon ciliatum]|uniref:uncharacterized protein LOC135804439 isoform X2 n=1 Tax=Sycon ciliatum TaxID=27933 RepID=UPI0031F6DE72